MTFRLTKHHGLANDFLVFLTDDPVVAADRDWWARARRWCDRTTGIGADGLIIGLRGRRDADLVMTLFNQDGSPAEISGNGLRCLVQAEARRRGEPKGELIVATGGGLRSVSYRPDPGGEPLALVACAEMGSVRPGPTPDRDRDVPAQVDAHDQTVLALDAREGISLDVGNPHLVLLVDDPEAVHPVVAGRLYEETYDGGMNVHFVAPTPGEDDAMDMVIWERGAGVTGACGTGAVAVAWAAHHWGLTGRRVTVHMPGGDAEVEVDDPMVLHGGAVFIADIEVPA